ncbi:unnamed protein product [marine sediment metagenome]|uniref:Uncharacterized protein n=1 Tax=marine sediment metagenome TaxID=412755 RepID=X1GR33_9ZZZZ
MNLPDWTPLLGIVTLVLVWIGVPTYVSWRYDITLKETFKSLWLYATGRSTKARLLLLEKEDRTKPVRWFFWIPFIGRFLIHNRDVKMHPEIKRTLIISLLENTAMYFVIGLIAGYNPNLTLQTSLGVILIIFLIMIPIEYKLTMWKPKLFLSDGDIEYVEYVSIFYHAFLFIVTGTLLGYLLKGGRVAC